LSEQHDPSAIFKARELRKKLNKTVPQEEPEASARKGEAIREFLPGMAVFAETLQKEGVLLTRPNGKGKVMVRFGVIQTEVDASSLSAVREEKPAVQGGARVHKTAEAVPLSLDVRGQLAEEAVLNVDRYLDSAFGQHIQTVTIIHGKGTGALRSAISAYLKTNKQVKSFRMGAYGEGDAGVTVVEMKM
ncbi:MAG: Smr/MutS family protein, partial [Clostridia bacterium]|nr:Smr/MutS family protein [Clostridia bacterium]